MVDEPTPEPINATIVRQNGRVIALPHSSPPIVVEAGRAAGARPARGIVRFLTADGVLAVHHDGDPVGLLSYYPAAWCTAVSGGAAIAELARLLATAPIAIDLDALRSVEIDA